MKYYLYNRMTEENLQELCIRSSEIDNHIRTKIKEIEEYVLHSKDKAIYDLSNKYDGCALSTLRVEEYEFIEASKIVDKKFKDAFTIAKKNIYKLHHSQLENLQSKKIETSKGVHCWRKFTPIKNVGLYIPAGSAPLFSTVLMLGIPAKIVGCENLIITTPADKYGKIVPEILFSAQELGIKKVFKVGGAQAIFALTYGTESIPSVDKIFGPGNAFVTAAKMHVSNKISIDLPAGPSEVCIICDEKSNSDFVAADILSQLEHGIDSQAVLITTSLQKYNEILFKIENQIKLLPRKEIAQQALQKSFALICEDINDAFKFSNLYAPEHLLLNIENHEKHLHLIENAGSVFCGPFSAESFGDYSSGTNHTLPTSGFAKSCSGLSLENFGKWISFQEVSLEGLQNLGTATEVLADCEKLQGHKNAISIRMKKNL